MELFENIEKQLTEIEILKSIYSNSNEFTLEDEEALVDATELIGNGFEEGSTLNKSLGFVLNFSILRNIEEDQINNKTNEVNNKVEIFTKQFTDIEI